MLARRNGRYRRILGRVGTGIALLALLVWTIAALLPIFATLLGSFKNTVEITSDPLGIPSDPRLSNFSEAWKGPEFGQPLIKYALNSMIAVSVGVALAMFAGTLAGYALGRGNRRIALLNRYFVILLTVPAVVTWVPLFGIASSFNVLSNPWALGVIYSAFVIPFVTVLMRAYFSSFPLDLIEAAKIDGASEFQAFVRIVLPTSLGMMSVVALIQAIMLWNELALAVVLLLNSADQTVPVGLVQFKLQFIQNLGPQFAGLILAIIPILLLYGVAQRKITEGMRLGALK